MMIRNKFDEELTQKGKEKRENKGNKKNRIVNDKSKKKQGFGK